MRESGRKAGEKLLDRRPPGHGRPEKFTPVIW